MDMIAKKLLIEEARELGCKSITFDGITYEIGKVQAVQEPQEVKFEDLVPKEDPDEILYWATPWYDHIQEEKKLKEQQLKEHEATNGKEAVRQKVRNA